MPRPLSSTVMELSGWMMTSTRSACPASASSIDLVDHLVDEVVQASLRCGADVHPGTLSDRLESLQYLDLSSVVGAEVIACRRRHFHPVRSPEKRPKMGPGALMKS